MTKKYTKKGGGVTASENARDRPKREGKGDRHPRDSEGEEGLVKKARGK